MTTRALRERPDDVAPLAAAMLLRHAVGSALPWLTAAALDKLGCHSWPGNVRELENVVQRALLLASGEDRIAAEHIVFDRAVALADTVTSPVSLEARRACGRRLDSVVRDTEADAILATLDDCNGSRIETARRLGISERTLRYRLARYRDEGVASVGAAR